MSKLIEQCHLSDAVIAKVASTNQHIAIKAGFAAEQLHTETFNCDAILKSDQSRAYTDKCANTLLSRNNPTNDIVIVNEGNIVKGAQLKYFQNGEKTANAFRDSRDGVHHYKDSDMLIGPSDQLSAIKESAKRTQLKNQSTRTQVSEDAKAVYDKTSDRLTFKDIESKPVSKKQAETIAKGDENGQTEHRSIQLEYQQKSTIQQSIAAAKSAALVTCVISGTLNTISCLSKVQRREMTPKEAAQYILTNTSVAVVDAALKAAVGTAAASTMAKTLPALFSGSALTANLASGGAAGAAICAVDLVECLVLVSCGRMTMAELETRAGTNVLQTSAGVVGASIGAVIGAAGGPPGVLIGSIIGGMITSVAMTVAIENGIEKPFRENLVNTEKLVHTENVMLNSLLYLEKAQTYYQDFRIGLYLSEQDFDRRMSSVNQLGIAMQKKLQSI